MSNFEPTPDPDRSSTNFEYVPSREFSDVLSRLLTGEITAYDMVGFSRENPEIASDGLKSTLISHESPYARLCSAWSLGEIGSPEDLPLLRSLYPQEEENNVRTNIVWAQFMIDADEVDEENFRNFLADNYYVIPLVAVKRLSGMSHLAGRFDLFDHYEVQDNQLVRLEMLRNIRCFRLSDDINTKLEAELRTTEHVLERSELIQAIGASNKTDSMKVLMSYYAEFREAILGDELMSASIVNAVFSLGQSDAHEALQEIYANQGSHAIRWRIIETLAMAGGPYSLAALRNIHAFEQDPVIKDSAQSFIDMMQVTTE